MRNLYEAQTFFREYALARAWSAPATGAAAIDEDTVVIAALRHLWLVSIVLALFLSPLFFSSSFLFLFLFSIAVLLPLLLLY